jgi:ribonuclease HI
MYILQFDGMLRASAKERSTRKGLLGYGWLIQRGGVEIAHGYGVFLRNCNAGSNAAEYLALIDGLEALLDMRIAQEIVEVRGDAKCVIDQMTGTAAVSSPLTRKLYQRTAQLSRHFPYLTWKWVPRRENRHADSLSRRSFHYLRFSPRPYNRSRAGYDRHEGLIPLVDLRVLAPVSSPR